MTMPKKRWRLTIWRGRSRMLCELLTNREMDLVEKVLYESELGRLFGGNDVLRSQDGLRLVIKEPADT